MPDVTALPPSALPIAGGLVPAGSLLLAIVSDAPWRRCNCRDTAGYDAPNVLGIGARSADSTYTPRATSRKSRGALDDTGRPVTGSSRWLESNAAYGGCAQ